MRTIRLSGPVDEAGFRRACRGLIADGVPPEAVVWQVAEEAADRDLFDESSAVTDRPADTVDAADASDASDAIRAGEEGELPIAGHRPPSTLRVPRAFADLLPDVLPHADPRRHALLYRLLWRLQREPGLRGDPLDPHWVQLRQMGQAVRRDAHKMTAFVRFRPIPDTGGDGDGDGVGDGVGVGDDGRTLHVAWFVPAHHVVERTAPFFARRFAALRWTILTPLRSVRWDGETLHFGPGATAEDAPAPDAGEALWLTYYRHIFNPARLKLAMMTREMPRRYWPALPEAALIAPLAQDATRREAEMLARPPPTPSPRRRLRSAPGERTVGSPNGPSNGPSRGVAAAAPGDEPGHSPGWSGDPTLRRPDPRAGEAASPADRGDALAQIQRAAGGCTRCPLYAGATQVVFGEGPVDARWMFVGEQPGDQEDLQGRPFVGPAGQLFDRALAELGRDRRAIYVANAVKHFKYELRGQRRIHKTPAQQEVAACLDWLEREVALVRPQRLVALGATAARALLGRPVPVLKARGRWLRRDDGLPVLVTLHPSALLRMPPEQKADAWRDWLVDLRHAFEDVAPDDAGC